MIRIIKLVSGEELMASVSGVTEVDGKEVIEKSVILDKPIGFQMMPKSQEEMAIQWYPWGLYIKDVENIEIDKKDVMLCVEPQTNIRNMYAEMVGLPTIPDDSIIIPEGGVPNIKLST